MLHRFSREMVEREAKRIKDSIDQLVELYLETDPSLGNISEHNKFIKAVQAISLSQSPAILSNWAERHIIGYFLNDENKDMNSHQNETIKKNAEDVKFRNAISFILDKLALNEEYGWREKLSYALQALNMGETFDILKAEKVKKRKNGFTVTHLRFAAVLHVYREWGRLNRKHLALEYVAEAINMSIENLQKWEKTEAKLLDPNATIRKYVQDGYILAKERDELHNSLKQKNRSYDFYDIWHKKQNELACVELMHHDMLLLDYPLPILGSLLSEVKN